MKIEAKELEKCIAGLNLLVANNPDEIEICKEEIEERLSSVMSSFKTKDRGVFVQASTLGSLEALLAFLKESKIPVSKVHLYKSKFQTKTYLENIDGNRLILSLGCECQNWTGGKKGCYEGISNVGTRRKIYNYPCFRCQN